LKNGCKGWFIASCIVVVCCPCFVWFLNFTELCS
jgi:hypothetical protein